LNSIYIKPNHRYVSTGVFIARVESDWALMYSAFNTH